MRSSKLKYMHYTIKPEITQSHTEALFELCQGYIIKMGFVYTNVCLQVVQLSKEKLTTMFLIQNTLNKIKMKLPKK